MLELRMEADTLVGWRCWRTFGGAQADRVGDNGQGAPDGCPLHFERRLERLTRLFPG